MSLGQLKIDERVFQAGMSQQQLDGTQVSPGINEVRGKGMPKCMRPDRFLDTGPLGTYATDFKDSLS